jgi:hypothetical protein
LPYTTAVRELPTGANVKRVRITLSHELEVALEGYVSIQEAKPSLAAVVQTALRQFLIGTWGWRRIMFVLHWIRGARANV